MNCTGKYQDVWDWIMDLRSNEIEEGKRQYIYWHYKRYFDSFVFLTPWLEGKRKLNILELGAGSESGSLFAQLLKRFTTCSQLNVSYTGSSDLRYPFAHEQQKITFDLILCMEVIEHIKDQEESNIELFNGSGIRNMLSEARSCLSEQGKIFITTPNPNSIYALRNLLLHRYPYQYEAHPRELNYENLRIFLQDTGFRISVKKFNDSWTHEQTGIQETMKKMLEDWGYSTSMREDNIFLLAEPTGEQRINNENK